MKKSLSALDLLAVAGELNAEVAGQAVDKVYGIGDSILLRVGREKRLIVANKNRVSLTTRMPPNVSPPLPPPCVLGLRGGAGWSV